MYTNSQSLIPYFSLNLLVLLLFISGCNYDPDDEFFVNIDPPSQPVATITLNDEDSALSIWQVTNFTYNISSEINIRVLEVQVLIDDELILSSTSASVEFTVNHESYFAGHHKIKIITLTSSGSGSLADKVNAETFVITKEWDLFIENRWPDSYNITEMVNENGVLKISWEKYSAINFQKYELYRSRTRMQDGSDFFELAATITDSTVNYFYDSSYVGGVRAYMVNVTAGNHTVSGFMDTVYYPLPEIIQSQFQGLDLQVTFSKCLFNKAFKEYGLYVNPNEEYYQDIEKALITNINDTTVVIRDLFFGSRFKLKLITYPVNVIYDIIDQKYKPVTYTYLFAGDTSFAFNYANYSIESGNIYFTKSFGGNVYMYNAIEDSVYYLIHNDAEVYGNFINISSNGNFLTYSDVQNGFSKLFTLPGVNQVANVNFMNITGGISNNGLVPVITQTEFMVFDFLNNKYIDTIRINDGNNPGGVYYGAQSHISADGEYLYVTTIDYDTLYHRNGDNYVAVAAPGNNFSFISYNPLKAGELLAYIDGNLTLYDYVNLEAKQTFPYINPPLSNVDPVTGYILAIVDVAENRYGLYDISDGSLKGSIRIANNISPEEMKLFNSILYSSNGYKINLIP